MHKILIAKKTGGDFEVWGDGKSLREFIYVNDLAKILVSLLDKEDIPERLIVSGEKEYSIKEIVDMLVDIADFSHSVVWDTTKPNGQRNRPSSKEKFNGLFPDFEYSDVYKSLKLSWEWFNEAYPNVRTAYND
jgi:GDP-L-fucose synthase